MARTRRRDSDASWSAVRNTVSEGLPETVDEATASRRLDRPRARRGGRGPRTSRLATFVTASLLGILVVGAPLACGTVHRPTILVALALAALLALASIWLAARCRSKLATAAALGFPLYFLALAALQIIPLPAGLRMLLDPKGSALLALAGLQGWQPLSLDPPETYAEFAKAAGASAAALAALALTSGRRFRSIVQALVACGGLAAMVLGLGHRVANEGRLFGLFPAPGGLMVGPFINPNHTAEFLELSAFAALAVAFARATRDGRRIWKLLAATLAAGAISTLSRGSLLALSAGALVWFALAPRSDEGEPFRRSRFVAFLLSLLVVIGLAIGFGGDRIIDEFRGTAGGNLSKLAIAKDALPIVLAHPAGIGMGAFGRVYPVYQSLPTDSWFEFVENQPLSILLEAGMVGAAILLGVWILVAHRFWKQARRDRVEASLVAGLAAVLAHNLVDFGLEAMGILLPFCAVLGTVFGRQSFPTEEPSLNRSAVSFGLVGSICALMAIVLLEFPAARDFDRLLKAPLNPSSRAVAQAASLAHPTDYLYALAEARLEPRTSDAASIQRRLRMLNRAMVLCPRCVGAHEEAARELWRLGRRRQSLLEWRIVVTEARPRLRAVLDELHAAGAKPEDLTALADDESRFAISRYVLSYGAIDAAKTALSQGSGPENAELYLVHAQIALAGKDIPAAKAATKRALELEPRNPRAIEAAADIALLDPDGAAKALAILEDGLRFAPTDVDLNRRVLRLLMQTDGWQAIDKALQDFRAALAAAGGPSTEANLAAAQIFERRGQFRPAMSEYQAALAHDPGNIGIRLALARAAEQIGDVTAAVDAYRDVVRRDSANREAQAALAKIQFDKKALEADSIAVPGTDREALRP
jgi:tetratricopeptide (TPR) repeat protein